MKYSIVCRYTDRVLSYLVIFFEAYPEGTCVQNTFLAHTQRVSGGAMYSRRFASNGILLGCAQYEFSECASKVSMEHCQYVLQLCSRLLSYFLFHCFFWYVLARFRDFKTNTKLNNILFDSFEMYQECVQHFKISTYVAIMTS